MATMATPLKWSTETLLNDPSEKLLMILPHPTSNQTQLLLSVLDIYQLKPPKLS